MVKLILECAIIDKGSAIELLEVHHCCYPISGLKSELEMFPHMVGGGVSCFVVGVLESIKIQLDDHGYSHQKHPLGFHLSFEDVHILDNFFGIARGGSGLVTCGGGSGSSGIEDSAYDIGVRVVMPEATPESGTLDGERPFPVVFLAEE